MCPPHLWLNGQLQKPSLFCFEPSSYAAAFCLTFPNFNSETAGPTLSMFNNLFVWCHCFAGRNRYSYRSIVPEANFRQISALCKSFPHCEFQQSSCKRAAQNSLALDSCLIYRHRYFKELTASPDRTVRSKRTTCQFSSFGL